MRKISLTRKILGTLSAGVALTALVAVTAPATAAAGESGTQAVQNFRNRATGNCLTPSGVNNGRLSPCLGGTPEANWEVLVWGDGTRRLESTVNRGQCLDFSHAYGLRTFGCNSSEFQSWWVTRYAGDVRFQNQATGLCLDDSFEFGVRAFPCGDASSVYQRWY